MFLGKFRKHIEEIRHKHPRLDVELRMPSYFPDSFTENVTLVIFDGDTFLHAKRILSASDLDSYTGDTEDLLIMVLDYLVKEIENAWKTYYGYCELNEEDLKDTKDTPPKKIFEDEKE